RNRRVAGSTVKTFARPPMKRCANSSRGTPGRRTPPETLTVTAMNRWSSVTYTTSPFVNHTADLPPVVDSRTTAPVGGYGCATVCHAPESLDAYAIHRPSGENVAKLSSNRV